MTHRSGDDSLLIQIPLQAQERPQGEALGLVRRQGSEGTLKLEAFFVVSWGGM